MSNVLSSLERRMVRLADDLSREASLWRSPGMQPTRWTCQHAAHEIRERARALAESGDCEVAEIWTQEAAALLARTRAKRHQLAQLQLASAGRRRPHAA